VTGLSTDVQAIAAGAAHTCALTSGGVRCWGDNSKGELGNNNPGSAQSVVPVPVLGLPSGIIQAVAAGNAQTCAVVGGSAWCWGSNQYGSLGSGSTDPTSYVPVQVSGLTSGVQDLSVGGDHGCALVFDATWCWGHNDHGQLTGTADSSVPVKDVLGYTDLGGNFQEISICSVNAGKGPFTAVMTAFYSSPGYAWGRNDHGQLGNGTSTDSTFAVDF
jgi:alpha-tubulin suppressor-like RCC1 family protein